MSREIIIFTDGSCQKGPRGPKCGYGIHFPNKEYPDVSQSFNLSPLTNQRAELFAIYKALDIIDSDNDNKYDTIRIYSDSEYSIKSVTLWIKTWKQNGWKTANNKPVMNLDIITKIDALMAKHNIIYTHVRAHTGMMDVNSLANHKVDILAKQGAQSLE